MKNFDFLERTALIFGGGGIEKLAQAKIAVFGVGGVGGYTVEALARSGIGRLDLFDYDDVCITNINRQIIATTKTVGRVKVEVAKERILEINPAAEVNTHKMFYTPETSSEVDLSQYDYIVDAIDTVSGKIELVARAGECGVPIICAMGAGNKVEASKLEVADIYKTSVCPLAKVMRYELRKRGVKKLKVVYSKELPRLKCRPPGSNAFVPSTAGLIIAGEVVKDLIGID
jgi:tRNA A37 threonylcarbamoyladenosine dehydratase